MTFVSSQILPASQRPKTRQPGRSIALRWRSRRTIWRSSQHLREWGNHRNKVQLTTADKPAMESHHSCGSGLILLGLVECWPTHRPSPPRKMLVCWIYQDVHVFAGQYGSDLLHSCQVRPPKWYKSYLYNLLCSSIICRCICICLLYVDHQKSSSVNKLKHGVLSRCVVKSCASDNCHYSSEDIEEKARPRLELISVHCSIR